MNILAIDYGQKNIGLAWMQEGLDMVLPFGKIKNEGHKKGNDELVRIIEKENIQKIIIGLPLTLEDGSENMNTKRVRAFGDMLKEKVKLPVEYIDERLSSFEADEMGGVASRDEKAAMVILQAYKDGL